MADHKASVFGLSPLDMLMSRVHVPKLLYFSSTCEPVAVLANLSTALALTIEAIPIIGGSIASSQLAKSQKESLSVQSPYFTVEEIFKQRPA